VPAIYPIFEVLIKENMGLSKKPIFLKRGRVLFLKVDLDFSLNS